MTRVIIQRASQCAEGVILLRALGFSSIFGVGFHVKQHLVGRVAVKAVSTITPSL